MSSTLSAQKAPFPPRTTKGEEGGREREARSLFPIVHTLKVASAAPLKSSSFLPWHSALVVERKKTTKGPGSNTSAKLCALHKIRRAVCPGQKCDKKWYVHYDRLVFFSGSASGSLRIPPDRRGGSICIICTQWGERGKVGRRGKKICSSFPDLRSRYDRLKEKEEASKRERERESKS